MIYFDNAATTKPNHEVLEVYNKINSECFANPSSTHRFGQEGATLLNRARAQIAASLKPNRIEAEEVIFTSGATESNNLAIKGIAHRYAKRGRHLITTKVEHSSVLETFKELEQEGFQVTYLPVDSEGQIDFSELQKSLTNDTILVSIMAVNNEIGTIYDIPELARYVKENSHGFFHTDATQALFKVEVDYRDCDLISFSAHKLNGLKGSGLLIKRKNVDIVPIFSGGGQEFGYRSGTSNLPTDIALATTFRVAAASFSQRVEAAAKLRSYLLEELNKIDEVAITSPSQSSPFILSFILREHKASVVVEALSQAGIMVSTKSACSSKKIGGSYVLKASGFSDRDSINGIRLSFSGEQTLDEGKVFVETLRNILSTIRKDNE